jgi:NAD+ synthase
MEQALSSQHLLQIDPAAETERLCSSIRELVFKVLRRRGAVLGLSGGIDSTIVAALCARALGPDRVLALLMPETDSSGESLRLGRLAAEAYGIRCIVEDITPILHAAGCYQRRDEAIRCVLPEYTSEYKSKIVLPGVLDGNLYNLFSIVVESPSGAQTRARLTADAYLTIVAAMNFKQRVRKMMEYHYADRFQYAVAGTPNRLEYDQGFFVKNGDGAADFKPIAHLYKTQVYQLAEYLEVSDEIRRRPPTTDTYSLAQSQEEFFFALPYDKLDLCLYGVNQGLSAVEIAAASGLTPEQVDRVYHDIDSKRRATRYLHTQPLLVENPPLHKS